MTRLSKNQLQSLIDENPLQSLAQLGSQAGSPRTEIEKLLKSYKLIDYRNQKIKSLRRKESRKRQDITQR